MLDLLLRLVRETWWWLVALVVLVDVLALWAIAASRWHAPKVKAIWAAIVLLLPVLGGVAWLAIGREKRSRR